MAQEAQSQRYCHTADDGGTAGTEHRRKSYHSVGNDVVQQDNGNRHAHTGGILHIIHTQDKLQQAVDKGSKGTPFNAPTVTDEYQRNHAANG